MMSDDDNDGQMIFGTIWGLKLPEIFLTGEEKTLKKPHPGILSRPDRSRARSVIGTHATDYSTAVDILLGII